MPAKYQGNGIECIYPDNWTVREDHSEEKINTFIIESPKGAFFSVSQYPWTCPPGEVLDLATQAVQEEYEDCEVEPCEAGLSMDDCRCVEICFFVLDMLVVSRLVAFSLNHKTYLIEQQAEDRDYAQLEVVFEAMIETVVQSIDKVHGLARLHSGEDQSI